MNKNKTGLNQNRNRKTTSNGKIVGGKKHTVYGIFSKIQERQAIMVKTNPTLASGQSNLVQSEPTSITLEISPLDSASLYEDIRKSNERGNAIEILPDIYSYSSNKGKKKIYGMIVSDWPEKETHTFIRDNQNRDARRLLNLSITKLLLSLNKNFVKNGSGKLKITTPTINDMIVYGGLKLEVVSDENKEENNEKEKVIKDREVIPGVLYARGNYGKDEEYDKEMTLELYNIPLLINHNGKDKIIIRNEQLRNYIGNMYLKWTKKEIEFKNGS